jgi:hypothetical protein
MSLFGLHDMSSFTGEHMDAKKRNVIVDSSTKVGYAIPII